MSFDEKVLEAVERIPRGKVATYRDIADSINTKAYRAVGQALKRNPHPISVPCHRVIRSDGSLGGYGGKMNSKKKVALLRKEGVGVNKGKVDLEEFGWK